MTLGNFGRAMGGGFGSTRNAVAMAAAMLAFAATAFVPAVLNDGDTFLHIAAGLRMLDARAVLFADPFSYTHAGAPWQAHEWLAEIAMAFAWRVSGWSGLLALFAGAAALTAGVLNWALGRRLVPKMQGAVTLLAMLCMTGSLLARPHLLALPLLAIWTAGLVRARDEDRAPSFWLLPVMALWINIHGSFLAGLAVAAGLALEALIAQRSARVLRDWGLFGLGALAAALLNPQGVAGVLFPLTLMATPSLGAVGEWQATTLSLFQPIVPVALAGLYVIVTRRVRLSLVRAAMLAGLLAMALLHVRHQIVFATVAPLLLAAPLATAFGESEDVRRWPAASAAFAGVIVLLLALRLSWPMVRSDSPVAPIAALAHVPPALRAQPVLNDYAFGGYLIFAGVRPYIDSRVELYGEAALARYAALIRPDPKMLDAELARWRIRWAILPPASPIVAELGARGWRQIWRDGVAVVQIRDGAPR